VTVGLFAFTSVQKLVKIVRTGNDQSEQNSTELNRLDAKSFASVYEHRRNFRRLRGQFQTEKAS